MPFNIYDTRTMLMALEQMKPPRTFLRDTFFSTVEVHDTLEVDIDIVKGARTMAAFVNPLHEGKLVEGRGYQTESYKPPYLKEKKPTTVQMLTYRTPGETVYEGSKSPEQRAAEKVGKDLADLDSRFTRREEWMAAQALFTGQVHAVGDGIDDLIDFNMDTDHKVVLTGGECWDEGETSDPMKDFRNWRRLILQDSGVTPGIAVLGRDVLETFIVHPKMLNILDNRRVEMGFINPSNLPNGVTYWGYLRDSALDIFTYDEWYLDDAGEEQPMVPPKKVLVGSDRARATLHYAMIQDIEAQANFAVKRYPKSWVTQDPSVRWLMLQSAPLPVPHQVDAFLTATVLE